MRTLHFVGLVLVIVGALNWGLVGLFDFDLVAYIFGGEGAVLSRIVYSLVGLAGVLLIVTSSILVPGEPTRRMPERQVPA